MNVLIEFSRQGLAHHKEAIELIRAETLNRGHKLTSDLLNDSMANNENLPEEVYDSLLKAISKADCIIIEGSAVSLSLGFVLTEAVNLSKPVLFLVKEESVTRQNRFASSIKSKLVSCKNYRTNDQLKDILSDFFSNHDDIKTRFNLVLPNRLNSFVTVQSRNAQISKTEYIIGLIDAEINSKS